MTLEQEIRKKDLECKMAIQEFVIMMLSRDDLTPGMVSAIAELATVIKRSLD